MSVVTKYSMDAEKAFDKLVALQGEEGRHHGNKLREEMARHEGYLAAISDAISALLSHEVQPDEEAPEPRGMRCPINGAPCNECKPGAPCAADAADCNHSPFPVGMSQAEYYGITKEE